MESSIFKNTIFKSLLNICNIIIPVIVGPYIARVLDKGLYGIYNNAYAQFQFVLILAGLGIYNYGMREISIVRNSPEKRNKIFSELFAIGLISNILIGVLFLIFVMMSFEGTELYIYLLMSFQLLGNMFYVEWFNEGFENYRFITTKTIIIRLVYVFAIFFFVRKTDDILPYTFVMSLTYFLNCMVSFIYIKKRTKICFKKLELKKHVKPLLYILIIVNVSLLYTQLDKIMLGQFVSPIAVTVYQIPHYIIGIINGLTVSIAVVSIPRLSHVLHNEGYKAYEAILEKASHSYLFILIPACFGVFVLSREIIILYGGSKYLDCIIPMAIFALVTIPGSYNYIFGNMILYINGKERQLAIINVIGGIINILLNILCIMFNCFNVITAIITLGLAYLSVCFIAWYYLNKKLHITYHIFTNTSMRYYLLSMLFIPIAIAGNFLISNFLLRIVAIVILCGGLYFVALYFYKDEVLDMLFMKFFHKRLLKET